PDRGPVVGLRRVRRRRQPGGELPDAVRPDDPAHLLRRSAQDAPRQGRFLGGKRAPPPARLSDEGGLIPFVERACAQGACVPRGDRYMLRTSIVAGFIAAAVLGSAGLAHAQVSVDIGIHLGSPPPLVAVPETPVSYAPSVNGNFFFFDGAYYVYRRGAW